MKVFLTSKTLLSTIPFLQLIATAHIACTITLNLYPPRNDFAHQAGHTYKSLRSQHSQLQTCIEGNSANRKINIE